MIKTSLFQSYNKQFMDVPGSFVERDTFWCLSRLNPLIGLQDSHAQLSPIVRLVYTDHTLMEGVGMRGQYVRTKQAYRLHR